MPAGTLKYSQRYTFRHPLLLESRRGQRRLVLAGVIVALIEGYLTVA